MPGGASPYRRGAVFENEVVRHLRELGYFAIRSPNSKSPVDVIAIKHGSFLIQCKRDGVFPPAEWNALYDMASNVGATPILASRAPRKPVSYQKLMARKDVPHQRQQLATWAPAP